MGDEMMTCCDCQFRYNCKEAESDNVSFSLCGIRLERLTQIELQKKWDKDYEEWQKQMKEKNCLNEVMK